MAIQNSNVSQTDSLAAVASNTDLGANRPT